MPDQANNLRELVRQGAVRAPTRSDRRPRLLVVIGGKEGVGTTTVAVNLAVAISRLGHPTLLADADSRGGNVADFLRVEPLPDPPDGHPVPEKTAPVLRSGPAGLFVLTAASPSDFVAQAPYAALGPPAAPLPVPAGGLDFVVADAGSGPTCSARSLWESADLAVLVTTSAPVSVMSSYGLIKSLVSPRRSVPLFTIVNRAPSRSVARQVYTQLARACRRFLAIRLGDAGHLNDDPQAGAARESGQPLVCGAPRSRLARRLQRLAKSLIRQTERAAATA